MVQSTLEKINALKSLIEDKNTTPTLIYNEGWMLRLVLNWLSENRENVGMNTNLKFLANSKWYSEAAIPTFFNHTNVGEGYETYTHADGVFGNIKEYNGKDYLELEDPCNQFVVIEAKIFSKYSKGNTNGVGYNQVARTIACMYQMAKTKGIDYKNFAFYTFLPDYKDQKIKDYDKFMNENFKKFNKPNGNDDSIVSVVKKRIEKFSSSIRQNFDIQSFENFVNNIKIGLFFWEGIMEIIKREDKNGKTYTEMQLFYDKCKEYNKKK